MSTAVMILFVRGHFRQKQVTTTVSTQQHYYNNNNNGMHSERAAAIRSHVVGK